MDKKYSHKRDAEQKWLSSIEKHKEEEKERKRREEEEKKDGYLW